MMKMPSCFRLLVKMDMLALALQLLLLGTGVLFIYDAGTQVGGMMANMWYQQLIWLLVGSVVYLACALIDYRVLGRISWVFYAVSIVLLLLVCIVGREINGARSWLGIGGLTIQPSEFAKPATLLFLCWAVTHRAWHKSPVPPWCVVGAVILLPLLLVLAQPDYGTALVFLPFAFSVAFVKGLRWRTILVWLALILVSIPFAFSVLAPHQKARLKVFLEPQTQAILVMASPFVTENYLERMRAGLERFFEEDEYQREENGAKRRPRDNWNARQSLIAVGSGGMTGKGFMKGTQHILGYLPKNVAPTDFIFSVIAEETGFFGSCLLVVMFICLLLCTCRTAILACDQFGLSLALGVAMVYATHVFINIGMTVQSAPIIGIPLPYVSYGGSFLLSIMALGGLCQNVHIRQQLKLEEDPE